MKRVRRPARSTSSPRPEVKGKAEQAQGPPALDGRGRWTGNKRGRRRVGGGATGREAHWRLYNSNARATPYSSTGGRTFVKYGFDRPWGLPNTPVFRQSISPMFVKSLFDLKVHFPLAALPNKIANHRGPGKRHRPGRLPMRV